MARIRLETLLLAGILPLLPAATGLAAATSTRITTR